jgi:adenylate cyclase
VSGLSEAELAARTGTSVEQIRHLADLRILEREGEGELYQPDDLSRVRLAEALHAAGVSFDDIGRAIGSGRLSLGFIHGVLVHPVSLLDKSYRDVSDEVDIPMETIERLYGMWGLPPPEPNQLVREDDAEMLTSLRAFPAHGLDPDTIVLANRFFGENLRRVAESQVRFFRANVIEPLVSSGMSRQQALDAIAPIATAIVPVSEVLVGWLHRRHLESYSLQEMVEIVEQGLEEAGFAPPRTSRETAIAFLDLSGYTRLTEESGDEAATSLAARLTELVVHASQSHSGHAVKLLGDGVMFHFTEPGPAVLCGLELVEKASELGLPPARFGINSGPVVFQDGDYFGRTVNVAARIADYARPREVLVSDAVAASEVDGVAYREIGPIALKGTTSPVTLHVASRS